MKADSPLVLLAEALLGETDTEKGAGRCGEGLGAEGGGVSGLPASPFFSHVLN